MIIKKTHGSLPQGPEQQRDVKRFALQGPDIQPSIKKPSQSKMKSQEKCSEITS